MARGNLPSLLLVVTVISLAATAARAHDEDSFTPVYPSNQGTQFTESDAGDFVLRCDNNNNDDVRFKVKEDKKLDRLPFKTTALISHAVPNSWVGMVVGKTGSIHASGPTAISTMPILPENRLQCKNQNKMIVPFKTKQEWQRAGKDFDFRNRKDDEGNLKAEADTETYGKDFEVRRKSTKKHGSGLARDRVVNVLDGAVQYWVRSDEGGYAKIHHYTDDCYADNWMLVGIEREGHSGMDDDDDDDGGDCITTRTWRPDSDGRKQLVCTCATSTVAQVAPAVGVEFRFQMDQGFSRTNNPEAIGIQEFADRFADFISYDLRKLTRESEKMFTLDYTGFTFDPKDAWRPRNEDGWYPNDKGNGISNGRNRRWNSQVVTDYDGDSWSANPAHGADASRPTRSDEVDQFGIIVRFYDDQDNILAALKQVTGYFNSGDESLFNHLKDGINFNSRLEKQVSIKTPSLTLIYAGRHHKQWKCNDDVCKYFDGDTYCNTDTNACEKNENDST